MTGAAFICGGDESPGGRDDCPNRLHDYPLPNGYNDAHEVAQRRLRRGWSNVLCPECNLYGWRTGLRDGETTPTPHKELDMHAPRDDDQPERDDARGVA